MSPIKWLLSKIAVFLHKLFIRRSTFNDYCVEKVAAIAAQFIDADEAMMKRVLANPPVADLDGKAGGGEIMASAERELIMGIWKALPPVGSRGKALGRGSWGRSPPETERIFIING